MSRCRGYIYKALESPRRGFNFDADLLETAYRTDDHDLLASIIAGIFERYSRVIDWRNAIVLPNSADKRVIKVLTLWFAREGVALARSHKSDNILVLAPHTDIRTWDGRWLTICGRRVPITHQLPLSIGPAEDGLFYDIVCSRDAFIELYDGTVIFVPGPRRTDVIDDD